MFNISELAEELTLDKLFASEISECGGSAEKSFFCPSTLFIVALFTGTFG